MIYVEDEEEELGLSTKINKNQIIEVQFDCLRSYEEKTVYLKGKDRIQFSILYNYASLQYRLNDLLPQITSVPTLIEQIQLVSGVGLKLISDDTVK